jgi:hypothetical protein
MFNFFIQDQRGRRVKIFIEDFEDDRSNANATYHMGSIVNGERIYGVSINGKLKINKFIELKYILDYILKVIQYIIYKYNSGDKDYLKDLELIQESFEDVMNFFRSQRFNYIFKHEIRHFFDHTRFGEVSMKPTVITKADIKRFSDNFKKLSGGEDIDEKTLNYLKYFSTNTEQNAHYIELANLLMDWLHNKPDHFIEFKPANELYKKFKDEVINKDQKLKDKFTAFFLTSTEEKILNRLYNLINLFKKGIDNE